MDFLIRGISFPITPADILKARPVVGLRRPADVPQHRPGGAVGACRDASGRRVNPQSAPAPSSPRDPPADIPDSSTPAGRSSRHARATRCLRLFKVVLEPHSMLTISTRGAFWCGFVGSALVAV